MSAQAGIAESGGRAARTRSQVPSPAIAWPPQTANAGMAIVPPPMPPARKLPKSRVTSGGRSKAANRKGDSTSQRALGGPPCRRQYRAQPSRPPTTTREREASRTFPARSPRPPAERHLRHEAAQPRSPRQSADRAAQDVPFHSLAVGRATRRQTAMTAVMARYWGPGPSRPRIGITRTFGTSGIQLAAHAQG